ncbi:MAG TPA: GAF domain-containing protein [Burkholderiales bacterium]|nr:GAF domain-containing protein [Burkholderiales bacterium]
MPAKKGATTRARASARRSEQLLRLEHQVTRLFAEGGEPALALRAALRAICESENWQLGRYLTADERRGVLRFGEAWSVADPAIELYVQESRAMEYAPGVGLVGKVWQSGEPLWVRDITDDPRVARAGLARRTGLRGALVVPVAHGGRTSGVFIFHSGEIRQPDDRLLQTVHLIGGQIAQLLKRTEAENALRASEARFRSLTELSTDWYWEQDEHFRFTVLSGAGAAANAGGGDPTVYLGKTRWEIGDLEPVEGDWLSHHAMLERRKPFRDVLLRRRMGDGNVRYMAVSGEPVFTEGRFSGYRGIARDVTRQVREEELLRLEHEVIQRFTGAGSISDSLQAAIRAICEMEGWDSGRYLSVDETRGVLRADEAWCVADPRVQRYVRDSRSVEYAPGHGLVGHVWQTQEPLWLADAANDPRVARPALNRDTGLRGSVVLPVHAHGKTVGVLILESRETRAPDERLLRALRAIGGQIGLLVTRSQAEQRLRHSEARFRSLTNLSSDWYWEQDAEYRFTRIEGRAVAGNDTLLGQRLIGARRWETGLQTEGGWDLHIAMLGAREAFHDLLMWRPMSDGAMRYIRVSGEPVFGAAGEFAGYRGVGRDVTAQQRNEQMLRLEHHVARILSEAEETVGGVKEIMRAVCEAEGWACGRYFRVDDEAGELRFEYGWCTAVAEEFLARSVGQRFKPGQGLAGIVWQTGEPLWSTDTSCDPRVMARTLAAGTGMRGAFVFPVVAAGKTIAVLSFTSGEVRKPDERLLRAASVIGAQVGQFLQRKSAEESLRESEARFRSLTQMSSDYFWESDAEHRITELAYGPNYAGKLGEEKIIGSVPWDFPSTTPDEAGWARVRATMDAHLPIRDFEFGRPLPDGSARYFSVSADPFFAADGRFLGYRGVGRDITESVLARERIASLAYSDALTGLSNRTSLKPTLEQAVERTRRRGSRLAGVFIDLDGFKKVNDLHGHDAGDRLLIELARRLRAQLRASDPVARLGGDEFFVVLEDVQDTMPVDSVARKLLASILEPFVVAPGKEATISASIGISVFPDDAGDGATLIKHADMAMYAAKQAGKNAYRFFTSGPAANDQKPGLSEQEA